MPLIIKVEKMKRQKTKEERRQELMIGKVMLIMFIAMFFYASIAAIISGGQL